MSKAATTVRRACSLGMVALSAYASGCASSGGAPGTGESPAAVPASDGASGAASQSRSTVGRAPDFTVDTVSGDTFRLADHLGKDVIVLDFWTTFCTPCIPAIEHLNGMYGRHKAEGLVVLGVAMDPPETAAQIVPFTRSHALKFPVAHDAQSRVTDLYNKKSTMPYQVLIGRDGRIRKLRESYQPGDEVGMEEDVVAALAAK